MFYVTSEKLLNRSKYDPKTREWQMSKLPVHRIVPGFEKLSLP